MKRMFVVLYVVMLALFAVGCDTRSQKDRLREWEKEQGNLVVANMHYIQDARTGLCFAHVFREWSLATVPCEAVPSHLLLVVR
ncbi:MAG: hypothetical protein Q7S96_02650 [bacterium]|nr:hypothetical protein [bacterium]